MHTCFHIVSSWLVLRSQLKDCDSAVNPSDQTLHLKTKKLNLSLEDWCDGAEDWERFVSLPLPTYVHVHVRTCMMSRCHFFIFF